MTDYLETRDDPFTDEEFAAIPRNADGDILDLEDAYPFITDAQRAHLTGDDETRIDSLDEEMRCLIAASQAEFGA